MFNEIQDYKSDLAKALAISANRSKNKLIIVTSAGVIIGKPMDYELLSRFAEEPNNEELDIDSEEYPTSAIIRLFNGIRKDKNPVADKGLWLKDVTINHGVEPTRMPLIFVFYDQIVGLSIGNNE